MGSPRPQSLAWEHANGSSCATTAGLPTTVRNPSAYDLSAAEGGPSDRHPRSRSRGKRHRCEAPSSPSKRRKRTQSHKALPHPEESDDSRNVDSTMRPLDNSTPSRSATARPFTAQDLRLQSTPHPPRPIRTRASGHPPRETRKGSIPSLSLQLQ